AAISHDLRTPLNSIIGYADLLSMGIPDTLTDASNERVARIRTSASHLLYLIDELLAYARLDARREELNLSSVDMHELTNEITAVVEPLASARGLRFETEFPAHNNIVLSTDVGKLRQVLFNLVGNAIKYT